MAGKEVYAGKKEGVVDKGINTWQGINKVEMFVELGAIGAGFLIGAPWLVGLGETGAAINGTQMVIIDNVKKSRKRKREASGLKIQEKMTRSGGSQGVIFEAPKSRVA